MEGHLPLPALVSQALVAFIIEFDDEFERRMPHRTTNHGSTPGAHDAPWLVSMAMWALEELSGELPRGLKPYPDGWRASLPPPQGLPHYPMILHRGGFPDGS
jgi:hypothetical protein